MELILSYNDNGTAGCTTRVRKLVNVLHANMMYVYNTLTDILYTYIIYGKISSV